MARETGSKPTTKRDLGADQHRAAMANRRRHFLGLHDFGAGHGLEIGPLDAAISDPQVHDVSYLDVYDADGVRAHYADDPNVILELIPDIDFALIDGGKIRPLAEAAQPGAPYDWVIASHVIEHVPDFIGWLQQVAAVTVDDGALVLVVPDRRYCFDRHRPPTTTGQALAAHEAGDTHPGIRAVYDFLSSAVTVDTRALWSGARPPGRAAATHDRAEVDAALARVRAGEYVDAHVWTFTPQWFLAQIKELRELGLCDWYVETLVEPTNSLEFHAVLRRLPRHADPAAVGFDEPALESDLPDWLHDEWVLADQVRVLREKVRVLRARNRRLRARLDSIEGSARMRIGGAVVDPVVRVRRALRRRR